VGTRKIEAPRGDVKFTELFRFKVGIITVIGACALIVFGYFLVL